MKFELPIFMRNFLNIKDTIAQAYQTKTRQINDTTRQDTNKYRQIRATNCLGRNLLKGKDRIGRARGDLVFQVYDKRSKPTHAAEKRLGHSQQPAENHVTIHVFSHHSARFMTVAFS